jgi:Tol biopolymer transport system component
MGEVYKAHDLTLERTVAIKILPPELVRNDERVRRFMQEAKSASSLNHPNIVTIHEIGQAVVSGNGDAHAIYYIAMELIEGATLRRKIHGDDTDLRTLLGYLAQAAEGLSKAHAAGIVHRDLKPENIMVTRDGFAKVLDFGLAKLSVKKSAEGSSDATVVRPDTREGTLLGTVGYMSPEQVQGKVVDHRSDIFSFGCILYEAATRKRPFEADSDVDVMHKIMHDKPTPVDEINPQVPAELRRVIRRCMAKDPEKRYQSMKDLALEMGEIVDEFEELSASATSASGSVATQLASTPTQRRLFRASIAAAALVALIATAVAIYSWRRPAATPAPAPAYASMRISKLTSTGTVVDAAISPDGRYVAQAVFDAAGKWLVSIRQVATGSDIPVVGASTTPIQNLTFSPDGDYLYYTQRELESGSGYATLFQVPALGGTARKITFDVDTPVAFSPDGKRIAFGRGYPPQAVNVVVVANVDGSNPRELLRRSRLGFSPVEVSWTQDGTRLITAVRDLTGGIHSELVELDVATDKARRIGSTSFRQIRHARLLADGSGIAFVGFTSESPRPQIWFQPLPDGTAVRITNDVNEYERISLTGDGKTLSAVVGSYDGDITICDVGDETRGKPYSPGTAELLPGSVSVSDNGAVAYDFDRGSGLQVGIVDGLGAAARALSDDGMSHDPSISADGKLIAFQSRRVEGIPHAFVCDADGGNVRDLGRGARPFISPDGKTVVFASGSASLFRNAAAGGTPEKIADQVNGAYAIDRTSTRLAYTYWKSVDGLNRLRLSVVPLAGGRPLADLPFTSNSSLRWNRTNDAITFIRAVGGAANIFAQPISGGEATQLTKFTKGYINSFDWTIDGKLILVRGEERGDVVLISNYR